MTGPRTTVVDDAEALAEAGANAIAAEIREHASLAIVAATGRTPMGAYRRLAGEAELNVARVRWFQLDEYVGLGPDDERSLFGWMMKGLVVPLGLGSDRVVGFGDPGAGTACGSEADLKRTCRAYDRAVAEAGGLGLAILGLGPNGHLGFNEPPSDPSSPTRVASLTPASVASNAGYWAGLPVPKRAFTAGLATLLAARRILLLVSGAAKRDILTRTLREPPTPDVPASFLQRHDDVHVIADRAAWIA